MPPADAEKIPLDDDTDAAAALDGQIEKPLICSANSISVTHVFLPNWEGPSSVYFVHHGRNFRLFLIVFVSD